MIYIMLVVCFIGSILLTPLVRKLAFRVGAMDKPEQRKVHQHIMPRLGGLAIYICFIIGALVINPDRAYHFPILVGSTIIVAIGILDDIYSLSAKIKFVGQTIAALVVVLWGGVQVEFINLPFGGQLEFGFLDIPITVLWIVGITNAINLIDGLDGLASGVSCIALFTITGMAMIMGNGYVVAISAIVLASTIGFLFFNFYPAKIFLGDTGALFLGFIIAVMSLLGFKNVAFISFVIPIIILGVPISDTFFAIIRRLVNKQPLMAPDKSHLHHCLLNIGFTHRQTVIIIYAMASFFGLVAVIFTQAKVWGAILLIATVLLVIEIIVEKIGLVGKNYKPILKFINDIRFAAEKNK
ncbi:MAG TPA: MraY family glycosyltransferase [Niallia sp.]|nr:MraY family glycosyltransferase [Niallia sp.]